MEVSREMEIRNLSVAITQNIAKLFDGDDSVLSLLMGNIVKDFDEPNSELRFTSADIDSIRDHAQRLMRSPILILLEEWGTMGRSRPKLHHLLSLLIRCQLFRAAEYVAQIIGESGIDRPTSGPAARVDIALPEDAMVNGLDSASNTENDNRDQREEKPAIASPIVNFNNTNESRVENVSIPRIPFRPANSDLIKFSTTASTLKVVASTSAMQSSQSSVPDFEALRNSNQIPATTNASQNIQSGLDMPNLSGLLDQSHSQDLPAVLDSIEVRNGPAPSRSDNEATANIPQISAIFGGQSTVGSINQSSKRGSSSTYDDSTTDDD